MPQTDQDIRSKESTMELMNTIARMLNTIYYTIRSVKICHISEYDELSYAISYLFPVDRSSINEIDLILSSVAFDKLFDFCKERNVDIKSLLNSYANSIESILNNNPIKNAVIMSEYVS